MLPFSSVYFYCLSDLVSTLSSVTKYLLKIIQHDLNNMTGFRGIN